MSSAATAKNDRSSWHANKIRVRSSKGVNRGRSRYRASSAAGVSNRARRCPSRTCDLMRQMEEDLDTRLDWIAVDHHNTGHPIRTSSCGASPTMARFSTSPATPSPTGCATVQANWSLGSSDIRPSMSSPASSPIRAVASTAPALASIFARRSLASSRSRPQNTYTAVAVIVVITVEEAALLMSVQRDVGVAHVKHDLLRRPLMLPPVLHISHGRRRWSPGSFRVRRMLLTAELGQ